MPAAGATPLSMFELEPRDADPDVMTVEEGAKFLRVGRNQLYDAIGRGDVPHRRIGKTIRLSRTVLARWLAGGAS